MFKQISGGEILLILGVLVLLFGARKLPDLARSIGASAKEFRKGLDEGVDEDEQTPAEQRNVAEMKARQVETEPTKRE